MNKTVFIKSFICLLIAANFILLLLRWLYWKLDYQYGYGDEIGTCLMKGDSESGYRALNSMYSEINYDIYYYVGFTLVLSVFLIVLDIINSNEVYDKKIKE